MYCKDCGKEFNEDFETDARCPDCLEKEWKGVIKNGRNKRRTGSVNKGIRRYN